MTTKYEFDDSDFRFSIDWSRDVPLMEASFLGKPIQGRNRFAELQACVKAFLLLAHRDRDDYVPLELGIWHPGEHNLLSYYEVSKKGDWMGLIPRSADCWAMSDEEREHEGDVEGTVFFSIKNAYALDAALTECLKTFEPVRSEPVVDACLPALAVAEEKINIFFSPAPPWLRPIEQFLEWIILSPGKALLLVSIIYFAVLIAGQYPAIRPCDHVKKANFQDKALSLSGIAIAAPVVGSPGKAQNSIDPYAGVPAKMNVLDRKTDKIISKLDLEISTRTEREQLKEDNAMLKRFITEECTTPSLEKTADKAGDKCTQVRPITYSN